MSKVVFLGVEGSGKTTLMMALAKEFERRKEDGLYLKPLTRDSFRFLKMLPEKIGEGSFPHQTASLRDLSWEIEENGVAVCELSVLDYPGEIYRLAFLDAKDESDPESFRQKVASNKAEIDSLLNAVKVADNIFVLFNLADAEDLGGNARNLDAVWVTNACLHLLKRLESKPAIEILLTQADRYEAVGIDPASFSLDSLDLIGHDHADVPWRFISATAAHDNEYGIDSLIDSDCRLDVIYKFADELQINRMDISSSFSISNKGRWTTKYALDYLGEKDISQILGETTAFYGSLGDFAKSAVDAKFTLSQKVKDLAQLNALFSELNGVMVGGGGKFWFLWITILLSRVQSKWGIRQVAAILNQLLKFGFSGMSSQEQLNRLRLPQEDILSQAKSFLPFSKAEVESLRIFKLRFSSCVRFEKANRVFGANRMIVHFTEESDVCQLVSDAEEFYRSRGRFKDLLDAHLDYADMVSDCKYICSAFINAEKEDNKLPGDDYDGGQFIRSFLVTVSNGVKSKWGLMQVVDLALHNLCP